MSNKKVVGIYNLEGCENKIFVDTVLATLQSCCNIETQVNTCKCDFTKKYGINTFPTFLLLKNNAILSVKAGRYDMSTYVSWINNYI